MPAKTQKKLHGHQTCDSYRFIFLAALFKSALGWPMGNSTLTQVSHGGVSLDEREPRNFEVLIPGQAGGKVL